MKTLTEIIIEKMEADIFSHSALTASVAGSAARLYSLLKRAMASGEIIQIRRGLYCLAEKYRRQPFDLFVVAQRVYGPSCISFESALSFHGWIPEAVRSVTSVSLGKAKEFRTPVGVLSFRPVPTNIFFEGVERLPSGAFMAKPLKALLDYIYIYKKDWLGLRPVAESLRVNGNLLKKVSRAEIRRYKSNYPQKRMQKFLVSVEKELGYEH